MFSLGMRKLLGIKPDEKTEECSANPTVKGPAGGKGSGEPVDRWRDFKIEAVGLTSLWFSFGSGILARFVVDWESGKDGGTMPVAPDLWLQVPLINYCQDLGSTLSAHDICFTQAADSDFFFMLEGLNICISSLWFILVQFLEDFINGAEVESLLDCIRLATGPLTALAAATRPARASTATGMPVIPATASSRQSNQIQQTQGIIAPTTFAAPNSVGQSASATSGSTVASPAPSPLSGSFHGVAMLAAGGRSGPGIVPSSLSCPSMYL